MRTPRKANDEGKYLCPDCKDWKDSDEFYKSAQTAVGVSTYCKVCHRARIKRQNQKRKARLDALLPTPQEEITKYLKDRGYRVEWGPEGRLVAEPYEDSTLEDPSWLVS